MSDNISSTLRSRASNDVNPCVILTLLGFLSTDLPNLLFYVQFDNSRVVISSLESQVFLFVLSVFCSVHPKCVAVL